MTNEELLRTGAQELGISLDDRQVESFMTYKALLSEWNEKINLTAINSDEEVVVKHFLDSLSLLSIEKLKENIKLSDIGTGAGFPGIALKIARPDMEVLLLDSLAKRVGFLNAVIDALGLKGVRAVHKRAEEGGRERGLRDSYDIAVSRAVAKLDILCEYCMPYVKPGGFFIAMKGNDIFSELDEAKPAINALGADLDGVISLTLPHSDIKRSLIILKKLRQTPPKYPRNQAQISKNPIK